MTDGRVARVSSRALVKNSDPEARIARVSNRALTRLTFAEGRVAQVNLRTLIEFCNDVWLYHGTGTEPFSEAYRTIAPVRLWNGVDWADIVTIQYWNGTDFVAQICPEIEYVACDMLLMEPFINLSAWSVVGTPTIVAGGRTGTGVQMDNFVGDAGDDIHYFIPAASESDILTMGFAWKVANVSQRVVAQFRSAGVASVELASNESGGFNFRRGTDTGVVFGSSGSGVYTTNTWYYLEMQVQLSNVGWAKLRVDGTMLIDVNGVDTKFTGAKRRFDSVAVGTSHDQVQTVDDLYLTSGPDCGLWGDQHFVLMEPFNNLTNWVHSGSVVAGRTGTAIQLLSSNSATYTIPVGNRDSTITVGFAYKQTGDLTNVRLLLQLLGDPPTNTNILSFQVLTTGAIQIRRGGTAGTIITGATTSDGIIVANVWYYIEVKTFLNDTTGTIKLLIDEISVLDLSSIDTNPGSSTVFDGVRLSAGTGAGVSSALYDDLYISTGPNSRFRGDITI